MSILSNKDCKIIGIVSLLMFPVLIAGILFSYTSYAFASNINWKEVPSNESGSQWWDTNSLKVINQGNLSVRSKFIPTLTNTSIEASSPNIYVMSIDCNRKLFRDLEVNGISKVNPKWESANGDALINEVINDVCNSEAIS